MYWFNMSLKGDILCCLKTALWTRKSLSLVNWFDVFMEVTFIFSLEAAKWTCKCLPFMDWFYVSLEISLSGGVLATKSTFEQFLHLWDQQLETFEKFWSTSKYIHYQNKRKCTLLSMVRRSIIFSLLQIHVVCEARNPPRKHTEWRPSGEGE